MEEESNIITLKTDEEDVEVEVIEQTVINGITYLLVATLKDEDAKEDDYEEEDECIILKDVSDNSSEEANYVIVSGEEEEDAWNVFKNILEGDDISLTK